MKILHTSDWHLGRTGFGQFSLLDDQHAFVSWLVSLVSEHRIDLVAIAGDVYDRAIPPPEAVRLFDRALHELREAGAEVVAIAGNHDSDDRFAVYSEFTVSAGVILRGGLPAGADVVIRDYPDGPLAIVPVPFLDPRRTSAGSPLLEGIDGPLTHDAVVGACLDAAAAEIPDGMRSLVLAHGWVAGGSPSDSERDVTVGGLGHVAAARFDAFSYTALGHLHRPQVLRGRPTVRYAGAPLPYSFGETDPKSVELVDLTVDGACEVTTLPVPVGRGVRTIRGPFDDLLQLEADGTSFVRAELTDTGPVRDAKRRLAAVFPYLCEIVPVGQQDSWSQVRSAQVIERMAVDELVSEFFVETTGSAPTTEELRVVLEALAAEAAAQADREAAA